MEGAYQLPAGATTQGHIKCPGLIRLSAGLTMQGHSISIRTKGLSDRNAQGCRVMKISRRFSIPRVSFVFQSRHCVGACCSLKKKLRRPCKRSKRDQSVMSSTGLLLSQTWDHIPWKNMSLLDPRYSPIPLKEKHLQSSMN